MLGSWDSSISVFMVTIMLSLKQSGTMPKLTIFKFLELPWENPTFLVYGHYNISRHPTRMLTPPSHLIEGVTVKNTHMNFHYHTESVSQHVDQFMKKKNVKKCRGKINYFPRRGEGGYPFEENSAKISLILF